MSARHNGKPMLNGTAKEENERVLVDHTHPVDYIEPQDPPAETEFARARPALAAALDYIRGDGRTVQALADERGVSKQAVGRCIVQICDRLGIPTIAPGKRRPKKKAAACQVATDDGVGFLQGQDVVNGEGNER